MAKENTNFIYFIVALAGILALSLFFSDNSFSNSFSSSSDDIQFSPSSAGTRTCACPLSGASDAGACSGINDDQCSNTKCHNGFDAAGVFQLEASCQTTPPTPSLQKKCNVGKCKGNMNGFTLENECPSPEVMQQDATSCKDHVCKWVSEGCGEEPGPCEVRRFNCKSGDAVGGAQSSGSIGTGNSILTGNAIAGDTPDLKGSSCDCNCPGGTVDVNTCAFADTIASCTDDDEGKCICKKVTPSLIDVPGSQYLTDVGCTANIPSDPPAACLTKCPRPDLPLEPGTFITINGNCDDGFPGNCGACAYVDLEAYLAGTIEVIGDNSFSCEGEDSGGDSSA